MSSGGSPHQGADSLQSRPKWPGQEVRPGGGELDIPVFPGTFQANLGIVFMQ